MHSTFIEREVTAVRKKGGSFLITVFHGRTAERQGWADRETDWAGMDYSVRRGNESD
jgi:hypothetical protein